MESSVKNTHREYGQIYQAGLMPEVRLIYSVKMQGRSRMFTAWGPTVNERDEYESHGSGYAIANFISHQMYSPMIPLTQLVILAMYIVYEAKIHADGCGGDTHIATLRNTGGSYLSVGTGVGWADEHFQYLDTFLGSAFLSAADLQTADDVVEREMQTFIDWMNLAREHQRRREVRAADFARNMKDAWAKARRTLLEQYYANRTRQSTSQTSKLEP